MPRRRWWDAIGRAQVRARPERGTRSNSLWREFSDALAGEIVVGSDGRAAVKLVAPQGVARRRAFELPSEGD